MYDVQEVSFMPMHHIMCFLVKVTGSVVLWSIPMYKNRYPLFSFLFTLIHGQHIFSSIHRTVSRDDPSSNSSQISPALVYKLDLPCSFVISGTQLATADLHVPTDGGGYHSHLSFSVSYGLGSNLVSSND